MKAAAKQREALARRLRWWEELRSDGLIGTTTKIVRHDNKAKAFIKPGSQNRKKGSSGKVKR